jgi:lambda family phage portal protein
VNWLDRFVIARVSPRWALQRAQARRALALYEAAEPSRTRRERKDKGSANAQTKRGAINLRTAARYLEQNLDIASGALDVICANVVGAGIIPEPQVMLTSGEPAEEFNRALLKLWDDWIHSPEVTRQHDYYSLQRLVCRTWIRDGEAFGQRLIGAVAGLDHNTVLPYSLEVLEPDFVPFDLEDRARGISQGVEVNAWGQPRAYWVYKNHPGDESTVLSASDVKRVSADRMIHVKLAKRLHQLRGVSQFASVINRLDDIKEIDESERVAARVAAAMSAFIEKGTPDMYDPGENRTNPDGTPALRTMEFVPGMVFDDLLPGEKVGSIASNRPNNALIPFRDAQLRSAAGGLGASFSSLSKNYNGTYSAQRQELVEQYQHYRTLSAQLIFRVCQPVWDGFIDAIRATNALSLTGVDVTTIYDASHTAPPMPWIDPVKEVEAAGMAEDRGYTSRSRIIRGRGDNPDQVNREIQRDQAEREALEISLRIDDKAKAAEAATLDAEEDRQAADERAAQEREAADARNDKLIKALSEQKPPEVYVTTGAVTVEPAVNNVHVAQPAVHNHLPETQVTVEAVMPATDPAPVTVVNEIAAPQVTVQNEFHAPARGPQVIEATKGPDGSLRAEVRDLPRH